MRWGVLGTGLIARRYVLGALRQAEDVQLAALASRSLDRAREVARQYPGVDAFGSYEALLADDSIEAVYLPLPNHVHAQWIRRAADAGKHVLCEKPLTLTAAEAADVEAHCRDRGVLLMEAFMYRLHPAWGRALALIEEGAIGSVTDVSVWFAFRSTRTDDDYRYVLEKGGGALLDVGCYAVDVARLFLGDEPTDVQASARFDPDSGVDVTLSAMLDYGEAQATFTCSMEQEPDHRFRVHGRRGWLSIADPFNAPAGHATTITIASGGDEHPHASQRKVMTIPGADQYGLQATALSQAIRTGSASPRPQGEATANMRLIERVAAAAGLQPPGQ
ncbi:MAG: Gfo/Idh/MocA family protein [Egibacteraceae bacterium]